MDGVSLLSLVLTTAQVSGTLLHDYEFTTKFNIENNTKRDDTQKYENGVNTPNDIPGILALGAQYEY